MDEGLLFIDNLRTYPGWKQKQKKALEAWQSRQIGKVKTDGPPNFFTIPQVLSKPFGMVSHSSGLQTQSIHWMKK